MPSCNPRTRAARRSLGSVSIARINLAAAALLLAPIAATAQTVVGTVVDRETTQPLAGAFVVLESDTGRRTGGALAGTDGRFILRAPGPGTYTLRAQFIGYADAVTESFELAEGQTVERTIAVAVRAVSLDGIRAEVGARCRPRPGSGPETARLWEEARKALEVAAWTEDHAALRFNIVEHKRELDATSLRVTAIQEVGRQGWYNESPYRSIPARELAEGGYVQPVPAEEAGVDSAGRPLTLWDHFAPDADVLLDDTFLDSHCFRVAASADPALAHLVGLAFEPVPGRDLPEIEGTLWIDRGTAELRSLDFSYKNLPYPSDDWHQVGGHVEFERLATGMWIVRRWHIRMPLAAEPVGGYGGEVVRLDLRSLTEDGAVVRTVRAPDGRVLARATGATLYGAVTDSITGEPLAGATVAVVPTGLRTTAGPDGVYRLGGLPTGAFRVAVTHPDVALLGGGPTVSDVTLEAGRATRLAIATSLIPLAMERCADIGSFADPVVVYGRVRAPDDETPIPGALVRLFQGAREERAVTDGDGGYALCIERTDTVAIAAVGPADALRDAAALRLHRMPVARGGVTQRDLTLDPDAMATIAQARATPRSQQWSNALVGTVVRHDSREPIAGAMVVVRDLDQRPVHSSVTNEDGQFRFAHPDAITDRFEISVQHVGYGSITQEVEFRPTEQLDIEVVLTERAIEIDPIVVTARREGFLADMGFYDRLERSTGLFIQREEIERRRPSRLTDLLQGRPGVMVVNTGFPKSDIRVNRPVTFGGECQPAIWVDGMKVRSAGTPRKDTLGVTGPVVYSQVQLSEVVDPSLVQALEFYDSPAGMPIQYSGSNASCGVVLIWTRRGAPASR